MHDLHDSMLLKRFAEEDSQDAFEILVARHAGLVLGVCHRIAGNSADAEDAAQATFIALALKAKRIDARAGLSGWLHRVAQQVSLDILKSGARRQRRQQEAARQELLERGPEHSRFGPALDESISALPAKLRNAVIGHYLEGRTLEELAELHQCQPSAISMRLTRGRELLRKRLMKGGLALGAGVLDQSAMAAFVAPVTREFTDATRRLVMAARAGVAATEPAVLGLMNVARQALRRMLFEQAKWALAGGTAVVCVALSASLVGNHRSLAEEPAKSPSLAQFAPIPPAPESKPGPMQAEAPPIEPVEPPLIAAIRKNHYRFEDAPKLKALLDSQTYHQPIDSIRDASGKSALHWAVIRGWDDFCTLLLLRGADVNAVDNRGYTPLFEAVDRQDTCAKLLIVRGAHINHVAKDGTTPLTHAIAAKDPKGMEMLLWLGAKTRLDNLPENQQPLVVAAATGDSAILDLVQAYDDDRNPTLQKSPRVIPTFVKNAFHDAARKADYDNLNAFLQGGVNVNLPDDAGKTALHRAIQAGQSDVVLYLLMLGANPNATDRNGWTPLMQSMGWLGGDLDAMRRFLLLKGASPFAVRKDGFDELTWAVERDNEHSTQILLWLGANGYEHTKHGTPFQIAFQGGHQRIMDLLRRNGVDEPIQLSQDPVWNLHNAVKRGDKALVAKLLAQGVPVDAPGPDGSSPLIVAILTRNTPTAEFLIQQGADINFINPKNGLTPLFQTICWDYHEMTLFRDALLRAGADVNAAMSGSGETALMRAVWHRPTMPLNQLLQFGAEINRRDKAGRTALGIAIRDGNLETAEYLRKLGATE